ncbi:histidine kinase [Xaviernesmea oryzae]|uniref:histidine kinase n=1 Tax=Xaviernesmea oryzae TaxID=464029 RepID=A0A1Q9AUH6_9HYPH|nr:sensor histidine kinase [Xaviernesmea oryzae]OLP59093.1 histidine kinase [Xaviernesmea oryzae]SEK86971.1 Two-component sensor histidine kinase, contains HisKA and HATPase domains [Xaviernesmea oryzae]
MVETAKTNPERAPPGEAETLARVRRPLAAYLAALLMVAIIPSFVFSLVILKRSTDNQDEVVSQLLRASTGSVTRVVEREIDTMLTTLKVLAALHRPGDKDFRAFYDRSLSALAGTSTNLLVIERSYRQLFNTRVPYGAPLPPVADPKSVDQAFRSGTTVVSDVFFGRTAGRWVFNVYLPLGDNGTSTEWVMALTRDADDLARVVGHGTLSAGWNAAVLDSAGRVVASSDPKLKPGTPFFMDIVPSHNTGLGTARYNGVDYRTVTEFSVTSGWRVVAWARQSDVNARVVNSYLWLSLGGVLFAALALVGSSAIARMLSQGVRGLVEDARRLGDGEAVAPRRHMIAELETVSEALSSAANARSEAESEIRFLMREVAHRSKNQLTVIQSMLNQSVHFNGTAQDFAEAFRRRIAGLARSTDLMIANAVQGVDMAELARNQLQPFIPEDSTRVVLQGPPLRLDAQVSQTLGMALHELATNATKYGALANGHGKVTLTWTMDDQLFRLVWRESGADLVVKDASPRRGFGTMVLERMLGMALEAQLERLMHDDGIEWHVAIPAHHLAPEEAAA